jgi:cytidine deaminase
MKDLHISSTITVFDNLDELPAEVKNLMRQAISVRQNAYAPYSKFRVGAALQLSNGEVVLGSNQENAAYPSGLCAERVAIFHSGATFPDAQVQRMCISAASDIHETTAPIPPCGACRQTIAEYEFRQDCPIEIYFMGASGSVFKSSSLKNLLPMSFDKNVL